ncbi:MAG: hypothetical protein IKU69_04120 [Roseburia sp.]|nr:hypothetical protein [Roseburia sp.]
MKKVNKNLNTIMNTVVIFFVCRSMFYIWDYLTNPDAYAMQSAPWYTAMLWLGIYTLGVVVVCCVIKVVVKHRIKDEENSSGE